MYWTPQWGYNLELMQPHTDRGHYQAFTAVLFISNEGWSGVEDCCLIVGGCIDQTLLGMQFMLIILIDCLLRPFDDGEERLNCCRGHSNKVTFTSTCF